MGKKTPDSQSNRPIHSPTAQFTVKSPDSQSIRPIHSETAQFHQLVLDRIRSICSVIYKKR